MSVVCYEDVNIQHTVSVEGDALAIQEVDNRKWYQHLHIFSQSTKITVYLPEGSYGTLTIKASTGNVTIPKGFSFASADMDITTGDITCCAAVSGDMALHITTGDVQLSDVTCRNLTATGTTGDITLNNVMASESFSIKCTTGDVMFNACDAATITVKTTTGDITGSLLTAKAFDAHATTGCVEVPQSTEGGRCKLKATTGDIKITIK